MLCFNVFDALNEQICNNVMFVSGVENALRFIKSDIYVPNKREWEQRERLCRSDLSTQLFISVRMLYHL